VPLPFRPRSESRYAQAQAANVVGCLDGFLGQENAKARSAEREHLDTEGVLRVPADLLADRPVQHGLHMIVVVEQERQRDEPELRLPIAQRAQVGPAHVERAELQRLGRGAQIE
jgi:hypothetical protein